MPESPRVALSTLYTQFDAIARGRDKHGDSGKAHAAILDRLAANRRDAETAGWTALQLERDGGMGRLRLVGLAPNAVPGVARRSVVPDTASLALGGD
jgi:hypothetical protein